MAILTLTVNSRAQTVDVDPTTPLLYVLSDDLTLWGPRWYAATMRGYGDHTMITFECRLPPYWFTVL
jgi:aerobic-type carbon monoxide dehydrogenase small subunit (CoxS/CutS family)